MSSEPSPTSDAPPTDPDATPASGAPQTDVSARGRSDPWAAPGEDDQRSVAAAAPRLFEPTGLRRLANLVDDENAYSG